MAKRKYTRDQVLAQCEVMLREHLGDGAYGFFAIGYDHDGTKTVSFRDFGGDSNVSAVIRAAYCMWCEDDDEDETADLTDEEDDDD